MEYEENQIAYEALWVLSQGTRQLGFQCYLLFLKDANDHKESGFLKKLVSKIFGSNLEEPVGQILHNAKIIYHLTNIKNLS